MDASGLPRWAFDELIGFSLDCDNPIRYVAESDTGPLALGNKGPRVARLQQRLRDLLLLQDKADGFFGRNTNNAVIDFQFLVGLNPDGIVGPKTAAALGLPNP
jgi:peptidoglycan hydrolase-like protein with peptidoglycan-binding domain